MRGGGGGQNECTVMHRLWNYARLHIGSLSLPEFVVSHKALFTTPRRIIENTRCCMLWGHRGEPILL